MEPRVTALKRLKLAVRGQDQPPTQEEFQKFLDGLDTEVEFSELVFDKVDQGDRIRFQYKEGSRQGRIGILLTPQEVQVRFDSAEIQSQPSYVALKKVLEDRFSVGQDLGPEDTVKALEEVHELDSVIDLGATEDGAEVQYALPSDDGPVFGEMELVVRKDGRFRVLRWDVGDPPRSMVLGGEVYSLEQVKSGLTTMQFSRTSENLEEGWKDWALAAVLAAAPIGSDAKTVGPAKTHAVSKKEAPVSPSKGRQEASTNIPLLWRLADSATEAFKGNLEAGPQVKYLVFFTLTVESGGGRWRSNQDGGSAAGLGQCLPGTSKDILGRWLPARPKLLRQFREYTGVLASPERMVAEAPKLLKTNDKFAAALCRLRYVYASESVPSDLKSIARYWKKHYNGSSSPSEMSSEGAVTSFLRLTGTSNLARK